MNGDILAWILWPLYRPLFWPHNTWHTYIYLEGKCPCIYIVYASLSMLLYSLYLLQGLHSCKVCTYYMVCTAAMPALLQDQQYYNSLHCCMVCTSARSALVQYLLQYSALLLGLHSYSKVSTSPPQLSSLLQGLHLYSTYCNSLHCARSVHTSWSVLYVARSVPTAWSALLQGLYLLKGLQSCKVCTNWKVCTAARSVPTERSALLQGLYLLHGLHCCKVCTYCMVCTAAMSVPTAWSAPLQGLNLLHSALALSVPTV